MVRKDIPANPEDLSYVDSIIINGRIAWVDHDHDRYIGIQEMKSIPTFAGEKIVVTHEFAFSPDMENRIGWGRKAVSVRMAFADSEINPHTVKEDRILSYYGLLDKEFAPVYSDLSGYLWTEERFQVGGHDLLAIFKDHAGQWIHIEIDIYEPQRYR